MVGMLRSSNRTSPGAWRTAPRMVPRLPRLATDDSVSASLTTFSSVLLIMGNLRSHLQGEGLKVPIAHDGHSEAGHGGDGWTGGRADCRRGGGTEGRRENPSPAERGVYPGLPGPWRRTIVRTPPWIR